MGKKRSSSSLGFGLGKWAFNLQELRPINKASPVPCHSHAGSGMPCRGWTRAPGASEFAKGVVVSSSLLDIVIDYEAT